MKRWLKKYMVTRKSVRNSRQLKKLKPYFDTSTFSSFECQPVARGVAAGLAGCVIPGFQFFYAVILAILLRGNLPIALLCTFITNPLTAIPIMYGISLVGSLIIHNGKTEFVIHDFKWDFSSYHAFLSNLGEWIFQFGKAFLVGVPIVSFCLGILGYFGTIFIWKLASAYFQNKKK